KIDEAVHQRRQCKVERAQAKNGEDIGRVDDKRVLGDGENRGHTVHGKYQISQFDKHQAEEEGSEVEHLLPGLRVKLTNEEVTAIQPIRNADMPPHKLQRSVLAEVGVLFFLLKEHLHTGDQQEATEQVENPVELLHKSGAQSDHDGPQHHHADNAPEE